MATIQVRKAKDGSISYRVRIQRKGYPVQSATFTQKKDAVKYGAMMDGRITEGRHFPQKPKPMTLAELLAKYTAEVLPRKAPQTQHDDQWYLRYWQKTLGHMLVTDITPRVLREQRDGLLQRMKSGSALRVLHVLSAVLTAGVKDYELIESNPMSRIRMPSPGASRRRYLSDEERARLLSACRKSQNPFLYKICALALYTGLRKGSLFALTTANTDIVNGIISLPTSKNGSPVTLPLVGEALVIVRELHATTEDGYLFPRGIGNPWTHYRKSWEFALKRAHLEDCHFHDLRRTSASYLIQAGVDLYTVSRVLSHKSIQTTQIYAHLHTDQIRDALHTLSTRLTQ